ncbi:MAG: histidine phosphatase family protein [Myxococcota bacterium]
MSDARFVLIRHGESTWNAAGRWQGQGDPPLSKRGRTQATRLALQLANEGIDVIVASDLARAAETAAILGEALGLEAESDPRLRELDVGRWTGRTRGEIEALDAGELRRFESGAPGARAGGGESRADVCDRGHPALLDIAARHPGRCVAVVAHLGLIRALLPGTQLDNAAWCRASREQIASPPGDGA